MSVNTEDSNKPTTAKKFFSHLHQYDNVTKNIIREIIRECNLKKVKINEDLVTFYVKLLTLNPKWGLSPDRSMSRTEVIALVDECVRKLCDVHSPKIVCLKMQLLFHTVWTSRKEMIEEQTNKYLEQIVLIEKELIQCEHIKTGDESEMESLFNKIVVYITLRAGLGNPLEESVHREAFIALNSIFAVTDVTHFANVLHEHEKRENLEELSNLVRGIRLYNRFCGKGGVGIEDVPKYLKEAIGVTETELKNTYIEVSKKAFELTSAIERSFEKDPTDVFYLSHHIEKFDPHDRRTYIQQAVSRKHIKYAKGLLTVMRQYQFYIRQMAREVNIVRTNTEFSITKYNEEIEKLHKIIVDRSTVPTSLVFPYFFRISETWANLLNETMILHKIKIILRELSNYSKNLNFDRAILTKMLTGRAFLTDAERLNKQYVYISYNIPTKCELLRPGSSLIPEEFLAFCPIELIEMSGVLIPGNPGNGMIRFNGFDFICSTPAKTAKFLLFPEITVNRVLDLARNRVELIFLLQLYDKLVKLKDVEVLYEKPVAGFETLDEEIQTELHPIPTRIVKNYYWNIWDLKREAIMLTNIVKCATRSPQTYKSNYRAPVETQTYSPRDKITEPRVDERTNVPKLQNYLFGLRGRKDHIQHIIELTEPIKDPKKCDINYYIKE